LVCVEIRILSSTNRGPDRKNRILTILLSDWPVTYYGQMTNLTMQEGDIFAIEAMVLSDCLAGHTSGVLLHYARKQMKVLMNNTSCELSNLKK
jgi:methionine aminopeptidase